MVNDLVLGQRVDQDRELAPVLGEPSKGSRKVLDRDPGLEAADGVWAQGGGVDSAAPDLGHNVEVALLDEGLDLGTELACGFEGFGIGLEEVGVEVELFHLLGLGDLEELGGRQGRGDFGDVHFFLGVESSGVEWSGEEKALLELLSLFSGREGRKNLFRVPLYFFFCGDTP